ncbi:AbrB/MazE/SpoVT family DNA-binding domain-containing protein [bacterium]|nr:AbrB/MazE/SpoVT family DNA-binding domain-containing protein [bacterium]
MNIKIQKWGNSLALRIPRVFAIDTHLKQGTIVDLTTIDGKLIVKPADERKYTLEFLLKGVSKNNLHSEIDTGHSVGLETW